MDSLLTEEALVMQVDSLLVLAEDTEDIVYIRDESLQLYLKTLEKGRA